jgi:hypothetical protein
MNSERIPVTFWSLSNTEAYVYPWTWDTLDSTPHYGYAYTAIPGLAGQNYKYDVHPLPMGTYFSWCIMWSEWTKPVWDLHGGGYWTEFIGTFHTFVNFTITLDENSQGYSQDYHEYARLEFSTGGGIPGFCGQPPGQVVTTETATPVPTATVPLTPTSTFTSSPVPSTATNTPTSTPTITPTFTSTFTPTSTATQVLQIVNFSGSWNSPSTCDNVDAPYRWQVSLQQDANGNVTGTIRFHKCPGQGQAYYSVSGTATYSSVLTLNGVKTGGRGDLGNSAPGSQTFTITKFGPPNPNLAP